VSEGKRTPYEVLAVQLGQLRYELAGHADTPNKKCLEVLAALRERVREAEEEHEKAMFSARQFCGAHIGKSYAECPVCRSIERDDRVHDVESERDAARAEVERLEDGIFMLMVGAVPAGDPYALEHLRDVGLDYEAIEARSISREAKVARRRLTQELELEHPPECQFRRSRGLLRCTCSIGESHD